VLLSSVPANGAENIPAGNIAIELTYNQNVFCPSVGHSQITLSGATIAEVSYSSSKVTIKASGLVKDKSYQLVVPDGVVLGPTKIGAKQVSLSFSTEKDVPVKASLCTSNPSAQAKKVYDFLRENYGSKIISGAMAKVSWNTDEADRVYRWTGKYPALNTFDYIHLYASPANWIDYSNISVVENWWGNRGLVSAMWHWNVPASQGSSDMGFYAKGKNGGSGETAFDISKAVQDGTYENTVVKADLENIANYLLLLQAKNIPVIWRPLHEAAGGWFWWGAKGAEPFKSLWKLLFDTFKAKGLKNLIWVWTTETGDDSWYPGDAYVDIIGRDMYNKTDASSLYAEYYSIKAKYPDKIITLSECGNVALVPDQWEKGALWSWFMPWYDYNATDESSNIHATKEYWINAFAFDKVITRDEMPDLK
jgi:mannan endo-1,4-beta-mannosidase